MQNGRKQDFHPGIVDLAARQRPGSMTKKARPILGLSPSSTKNELASKPTRAPMSAVTKPVVTRPPKPSAPTGSMCHAAAPK
jgi:hypothetical protein